MHWIKNDWIGAKEKCAIKKVVKLADQLQKFIPSKEVIDLICGKVESVLHLCIDYCDGVSRQMPLKHLSTMQSSCFQGILEYSADTAADVVQWSL